MAWLSRFPYRAALSSILAIPAALLLFRPIFGPYPGGAWEILLTCLYSLGLCYALLTFCWMCVRHEQASLPSSTTTPGPGYWITAATLSAATASLTLFATATHLNSQHAYWAKVTLVTDAVEPPQLALRYGAAPQDAATIEWQPYNQTILTLQRQASPDALPVIIDQIAADRKPIDQTEIIVDGGKHDDHSVSLMDPWGGMVRWPHPARQLSFLASGGPETATFFWLDQSRTVHLTPSPQSIDFELDTRYQGWALLPPRRMDSLRLVSPSSVSDPFLVHLQLKPPLAPPLDLESARYEPTARNELLWTLPVPNNVSKPTFLVGAWMAIWCAGLFAVWAMYRTSTYLKGWRGRLDGVLPAGTPPNKGSIAIPALLVWIVCVACHLVFALSLPIAYTRDSVGYYEMAHQLIDSPYLQTVDITRTPGYPLFLSLIVAVFGDTVIPIAILQHLALASLSVVAMWCLWDRLPKAWVIFAGLAVGIAPVIAPTGNVLWTESLFCVFSSSALLMASCYRRRSSYLFFAGVCSGIATMIRPNGLIVTGVMLASLALRFFWSRGAVSTRTLMSSGSALIGGYLIVAAPWHLHLAVKRGTWEIGKTLPEFANWQGYVFQRRLPLDLPINAPNRAIFAFPDAYENNPYVALENFPLMMGNSPTEYYRETRSEWFASQPLTPYWENLKYYATLGTGKSRLPMVMDQIRVLLASWRNSGARTPLPAVFKSSSESLLLNLTSAPPPIRMRRADVYLALGEFVLNHWNWLALLAMPGAFFFCFAKPWPIHFVAYAAATILVYSTNLVLAERYIAPLEPLFYIQVIAMLHSAVTLFLNQRGRITN